MPDFAYIARDGRGEKIAGTISAASQREAATLLAGKSLFPVQLTIDEPRAALFGRRGIASELKATTYDQLSSLLRSGVPLLKSIDILRRQTSHVTLRKLLDDIYQRVEDGAALADAAARHPQMFSPMAVGMIRAGSEGGFLEDALERIAQFTQEQQDLKSRTIGAIIYPGLLAGVGTIVVSGLLVFFVPSFEEIFEDLRARGELPAATEWLLWSSNTVNRYWPLILIVLAAAGAYLAVWLRSDAGQRQKDRVKLKLPVAGKIFQSLAIARFCRVLGTLLKSGVPILRSLEISRDAAGNRIVADAVARASENVSSGETLAGPLAASGHFPQTVIEMIAVAEQSNSMETVLVQIADGLERRTARRLDLMVRLLEPAMLMVLAGVVLFVVIALLLPVLKMSTTL